MRSEKDLIKEGIINKDQVFSRAYVAAFYKEQLKKFDKIGIGNRTENEVIVTQKLIDITARRLRELQPLSGKDVAEFYKKLLQIKSKEKE